MAADHSYTLTSMGVDCSSSLIDSLGNIWRGGLSDGKIYKYPVGGPWAENYDYSGTGYGDIQLFFEDSTGNLYFSRAGGNQLMRSVDGGLNWANCKNASNMVANKSSFWQMAEDAGGNVYAGEYSHGDGTELQGYIYKTVDNGANWTTIWNNPDNARHSHMVAVDPVTDRLYVSLGDLAAPSKFAYSDNQGGAWATIASGATLYKYLSVVFGSGYRVLGTDDTTGRMFVTYDDANLNQIYKAANNYDQNQWYWIRQSGDICVAGGQSEGASIDMAVVLLSYDGGYSWQVIDQQVKSGTSWGFWRCSNFSGDTLYYADKIGTDMIKLVVT